MWARLHSLETTGDQYESGLPLVRDTLLPWARESSGYRGLIGLVDRASGKALVLTLWADRDSFERSAGAAQALGTAAADATGARRVALDDFEVDIFDVPSA